MNPLHTEEKRPSWLDWRQLLSFPVQLLPLQSSVLLSSVKTVILVSQEAGGLERHVLE